MRILALDVGSKRIGLAASDPLGDHRPGSCPPDRKNPQADLERLVEVARQWGVQRIVVGLPRHMDGRLGSSAPQILELVEVLQKTLGVEVVTSEERLTTVEAEKVLIQADVSRQRRRQVVDRTGGSAHLTELSGPPATAPGCLNFHPASPPLPSPGRTLTAYWLADPCPVTWASTSLSTLKFFSPRPKPLFPEKWDEPRAFRSFSGIRLRIYSAKCPANGSITHRQGPT